MQVLLLDLRSAEELFFCCCYRYRRRCAVGFAELSTFLVAKKKAPYCGLMVRGGPFVSHV